MRSRDKQHDAKNHKNRGGAMSVSMMVAESVKTYGIGFWIMAGYAVLIISVCFAGDRKIRQHLKRCENGDKSPTA